MALQFARHYYQMVKGIYDINFVWMPIFIQWRVQPNSTFCLASRSGLYKEVFGGMDIPKEGSGLFNAS